MVWQKIYTGKKKLNVIKLSFSIFWKYNSDIAVVLEPWSAGLKTWICTCSYAFFFPNSWEEISDKSLVLLFYFFLYLKVKCKGFEYLILLLYSIKIHKNGEKTNFWHQVCHRLSVNTGKFMVYCRSLTWLSPLGKPRLWRHSVLIILPSRYIYLLTPLAKIVSKFAWAEQDLSSQQELSPNSPNI